MGECRDQDNEAHQHANKTVMNFCNRSHRRTWVVRRRFRLIEIAEINFIMVIRFQRKKLNILSSDSSVAAPHKSARWAKGEDLIEPESSRNNNQFIARMSSRAF